MKEMGCLEGRREAATCRTDMCSMNAALISQGGPRKGETLRERGESEREKRESREERAREASEAKVASEAREARDVRVARRVWVV